MNSHQRRKAKRAVERGYGPRHALNAQEGDELVPEELPSPPAEDLRIRRNSMGNLRPANLLKLLGGELGSLTKEDVAKLGISLLMGGEGPMEPSLPPSAKPLQPGLKFHDPHPRYEGPPEAVKEPFSGFNEQQMQEALKQAGKLGGNEQEAFWSMFWKKHHNPEMSAGDLMKSQPDDTFPSLNKPPYDALKESGSDQHLPEFTEADHNALQDKLGKLEGYKGSESEKDQQALDELSALQKKYGNDEPLEMDMTEPLPGQNELADKGIFEGDPQFKDHLQAMQEYQGYVNDPHVIKPMSYEQFAKENFGLGGGPAEGSTAHMSPGEVPDKEKHFSDLNQAYIDGHPIHGDAADLYHVQFGENPDNTLKFSELLTSDGWTKQGDHYVPPDYTGGPLKHDPGGDAFDEHMDELLNGPKEEKYIDNPYYHEGTPEDNPWAPQDPEGWKDTVSGLGDLIQKHIDQPGKSHVPPESTAHMSPKEAADHLSGTHDPEEAHDKHFEDIGKAYEEDKPINAQAAESEDYEMWHADEASQLYADFLKKQGWVKKGDHYVPPREAPPEESSDFTPDVPRYAKGTSGVRHNPKTKTGRPKKIGVDPGFGPRHAANAKEGEDLTQVNTDTVPAMLTPREAVLNRNAAELAGRGNIEQLNEQGNELAKQGVDLASGESNVPDPKADERRLAGGGAESALLRQLYEKYGNLVPEYLLYPDVLNEIQNQGIGDPQMAQRGTANMKPKPKTPPSKPKPAPKPVKPSAPPSGSPYVQGFQNLTPQGLQGGGYADQMPGLQPRNFPHPMAGKMHESMPGFGGEPPGSYGAALPGLGGGMQRYAPPGLLGVNGPAPTDRNFPHPNAGLMHPGGPYAGNLGGGAVLGQPGGTLGQPGGWNPIGGGGGMTPYGGGGGEPPGAYGAKPFQYQGLKGLGSGSFYPKGGQGYADGTTDVTPPIGAANTSAAYGPPIQLTAPDISKILQLEGQKQGLTSSQVAGLAKAFQGFGQGYNELSGGAGSMADMATAASGAYQGGISDIGYPPMIAPDAEYDPYRAGWIGQYNPERMIPRYARGSDDIEPGILGGNRNADSWLADLPPGVTVFGGRHPGSGFINRSSYNPGGSFGGAPGMPWSPTKIPTTYDPQGYPYGVPVQGPDQNVQGVGRTHNLRQNQ